MRTDWQKREFAKECLEIEKAGGDVLGYIETNWPSYTPRATWYNLQRQYLGRKNYQLTEGKPAVLHSPRKKKILEKEEDEMRKEKVSQAETAQAVVNCLQTGGSVRDCLTGLGFANVSSALRNAKAWVRKNRPEWTELIDRARIGPGKKVQKPVPEPAEEKPIENPPEEEKAVETVIMNGKEYERMKPAPTCCQPARGSGVTVPDELPVEPKAPEKPLQICAVKSRIKGEWHLSQVEGCVHLIWEDRMTHEERSLGLPAADWMKLAGEIPQMLMQLGLAN